MVVDIEWVQILLQNCEEILSEVCMIKKGPYSSVYLRRDEKKYV